MNLEGQFTGVGVSNVISLKGRASVLIDGGSGAVEVQRSYDGGNTWRTVSRDSAGNPATYDPSVNTFHGFIDEPEHGIRYRLNCSTYVSGPISYRIGRA